jgi:Fic family protein
LAQYFVDTQIDISLIVSNDAIMTPPYDITNLILRLVSEISEKIGEVNANFLNRQSPQLRKQNRIKTIYSSLSIEGNTLSEEQMTALIENKRIIAPQKDVTEVLNAIEVYDNLQNYDPGIEKSFLAAHKILMKGLLKDAGKYRKQSVGIVKGDQVEHVAPPYENVPFLMKDLFIYVKRSDELPLIKSCVFHYEMEVIHPFLDGNGRMGRLWQTLILMNSYPVFEYLPFETLISQTQGEYYSSLSESDKTGKSTLFIEYMLGVINNSLSVLLNYKGRVLTDENRLAYFLENGPMAFTRKDYMSLFKDISSATASRDLKKGIDQGLFDKVGSLNKTTYRRK